MTNFELATRWRRKYYPQRLTNVMARRMTWLQCARHALRKWQGLRCSVLKAHKLDVSTAGASILRMDARGQYVKVFSPRGDTCALCVRASLLYKGNERIYGSQCELCPLYAVRGRVKCTSTDSWVERWSPWSYWVGYSDPRPMIRNLNELIRFLKTKAGRDWAYIQPVF